MGVYRWCQEFYCVFIIILLKLEDEYTRGSFPFNVGCRLYLSLQLPLSPIKSNSRWCLCVWERHTDTHKCLITGLVPYKSNQKVRDALIPLFRCLFKVILRSFTLFLWLSTVLMRVWITARGKKKKSFRGNYSIPWFLQWRTDVSQWHSCAHVQRPNDFSWGQIRFLWGFFWWGVEYCSWWL